MSENETFAERLKRLRKKNKQTQPELAFLIGVHETTIRRWENKGDKPNLKEVKKLAQALHVSEDELLNGSPEDNKSWVLHVEISHNSEKENFIDMKAPIKPRSTIITTAEDGYLELGGDYSLWTDDNLFKKLIADMKKLRASVIQNGLALGGIKQ